MDLDSQFHDGVYLVLLMGLLEGYFVPLFDFHLTPQDFDQKVHNVSLAFELMQDAGLAKPKARSEGKFLIIHGVVYLIYLKKYIRPLKIINCLAVKKVFIKSICLY